MPWLIALPTGPGIEGVPGRTLASSRENKVLMQLYKMPFKILMFWHQTRTSDCFVLLSNNFFTCLQKCFCMSSYEDAGKKAK